MTATHDIFVSYSRRDREPVEALVTLLRDRYSLRVWLDTAHIDPFEPLTEAIRTGIASSRTMLVWYSHEYPASRVCQWELTTAYLAAQRQGSIAGRILVVNPESHTSHIHPIPLRDQNFLQIADSAIDSTELPRIAAALAAHLATLGQRVLSSARDRQRPAWYGRTPLGSNHFVGRLSETWRVHSALFPDPIDVRSRERAEMAQLVGLGGQGKTLLAEEYAMRFGDAFPAGVFWLTALGPSSDAASVTGSHPQLLQSQQRSLLTELGGSAGSSDDPESVKAALRVKLDALTSAADGEAPRPFLWLVDDVPDGLSRQELEVWLAPHPAGKTLFTSRSRSFDAFGTVVPVGALEPDDAVRLLESRCEPADEAERREAALLAADLGHHAMALELAGAMLAASIGLMTYASYRERLAVPTSDVLELAAELVTELPTGHVPSIATTLLQSVEKVGPQGLEVLRLAAQLSSVPIPSSLVAGAFAVADSLSDADAVEWAVRGFEQCHRLSLIEPRSKAGQFVVHALVSRTLRFLDRAGDRHALLRRAAVDALNEVLPGVQDVRRHADLAFHVTHGRFLLITADDSEATASLAGWLARFDFEQGHHAAALELSRAYVAACVRHFGDTAPKTLLALGDLARALKATRRWEEALHIEEAVLEHRRAALGPEHVDTMTAMNNKAATLTGLGRHQESLALHQETLEMRARCLGDDHEHTLFSVNNVGDVCHSLGRTAEAKVFLTRAVAGRRRALGDDHADTLVSINQLAWIHLELQELAEAEALVTEVCTARARILGPANPHTISAQAGLGRLLISVGKYEQARELLSSTYRHSVRALGKEHSTTLVVTNNLARALFFIGELQASLPLQEEAFEGNLRTAGREATLTAHYAANLLELLARLGDRDRAEGVFQRALAWLVERPPSTLTRDLAGIRQRVLGLRAS